MNNYIHQSPYNGCDLYQGDALDVLPMLAEQGIKVDMILRPSLRYYSLPLGFAHRYNKDVGGASWRYYACDSRIALLSATIYQRAWNLKPQAATLFVGVGEDTTYGLSEC